MLLCLNQKDLAEDLQIFILNLKTNESQKVTNFESAKSSKMELFGKYFREMLNQGVYLAPSQYESLFLSKSITVELADRIIEANRAALKKIH